MLALGVGTAACGETTAPNTFESSIDFDMALVAADATLEDVAMWGHPLRFAPSPAPGRPGGHEGWDGALSGTREVTFFDGNGDEQAAYDSLTTAMIHILHDVEGEVTRDGWTVTIERTRDKIVSGLEGIETHRTWSGTGTEHVTRSGFTLDGAERSYDAEGTFTYDDVVVPIPGSIPRWPVSGTITRNMTVTVTGPNGTRTRTVDVAITFNGTSRATATINGETRQIDLTTRDGRLPFRRR